MLYPAGTNSAIHDYTYPSPFSMSSKVSVITKAVLDYPNVNTSYFSALQVIAFLPCDNSYY